jgi:hypothetical protein
MTWARARSGTAEKRYHRQNARLGSWLSGERRGRVKRTDVAVAFEISGIEREDVLHRVDAHDSNEPGIIDLHALNSVVLYDLFPYGLDRRNIRQQG